MSHILVVVGSDDRALSGADNMAWLTAVALSQRGHHVTLITNSASLRSKCAGVIAALAPEEVGLSGERLPRHPDIVHAFDLAHPATAAYAFRIAEQTGATYALTPASALAVWPDLGVGKWLCTSADVVFALTNQEAGWLTAAGTDARRIVCVGQGPNLIDIGEGSALRNALGSDTPIVLFLGRRTLAKGCIQLLRAAPLVWRLLPEAVFLFAGPCIDPRVAAVFAGCSDPRIQDLAVVDERRKAEVLGACDLLCLPSTAEVFPLVFVEAWASAKPVVSGDFVGSREIVRNGVDGIIVQQEPTSIASALIDLLIHKDQRIAMGKAGQARAESDFSWKTIAADVERGYRVPEAIGAG